MARTTTTSTKTLMPRNKSIAPPRINTNDKAAGVQRVSQAKLAVSEQRYPRLKPALQLAQRKLADHGHAQVAVVQAGDGEEIAAAMLFEDVRVLDRDFFQGFQAIRREARRDHGKILHPFLGQGFDCLVGIRPDPFGAAETRLESEHE